MDVRIVAAGRVVDLEAQNYPQSVDNRSLLYASHLMAAGTAKVNDYDSIPQVVVITLLNDTPVFPESADFVSVCGLGWHSPEGAPIARGTDRLLFVLVELQKVRREHPSIDGSVLADEALAWAYLLTNGYSSEGEIDAIVDEFPDIAEFAERYGMAANDPKVVQAYEDALSAEREYNARQKYFARVEREAADRGFERGWAKGRAEGRAEGKAEGRAEEYQRIVGILQQRGVDTSGLMDMSS